MTKTGPQLYRVGDLHPATSHRTAPSQDRQIRPGDMVRVPGFGQAWLIVELVESPAVVIVRGPNDVPLRVGRATIGEVIARGEHEN